MRVGTLVAIALCGALGGCSGQKPVIGSSLDEIPPQTSAAGGQTTGLGGGAAPRGGSGGAAGGGGAAAVDPAPVADSDALEAPPPPDPARVGALLDQSGEAETDNALHLQLEVGPAPAGELWLVGVVNRGTENVKVDFDLRRLTLTLTPPEPAPKPRGYRPKRKPIVCRLPEGFAGLPDDVEPQLLVPGEGLVQSFDPRLYCISASGESQLTTGQRVTPQLGFPPKPPRVVWKQGHKSELPAAQLAPFVAEPESPPSAPIDAEHEPRVKQLTGSAFTLTQEMTAGEAEADPSLPLELRLLRGSDASTELGATVTLEVRARKKSQLYFRRELVSFTVHGPGGIRVCDPQPDDRSPDRQAYQTLLPGHGVTATSLLAELCPKFTFGRPGLYVVSARLDAERDGAEFGLRAFTGRLESRKEALIRIKKGDLPAAPPPEPLRVKVGQ